MSRGAWCSDEAVCLGLIVLKYRGRTKYTRGLEHRKLYVTIIGSVLNRKCSDLETAMTGNETRPQKEVARVSGRFRVSGPASSRAYSKGRHRVVEIHVGGCQN